MFMGIQTRTLFLLGCLSFHSAYSCENIPSITETLVLHAQAFFNAHKNRVIESAHERKCSLKVAALLDDIARAYENRSNDQHTVHELERITARLLDQLQACCVTQDGGELVAQCGQMRFANRVRLHSVKYVYYLNQLLERLDSIADWMAYWYAQGSSSYAAYVLSQPVRNWCLPRNRMRYVENKITLLKQAQRTCRVQLAILLERMMDHAHALKVVSSHAHEDALCVACAQDMHTVIAGIARADGCKRHVEPPSFVGRYWPAVLLSSVASIIGVRIGYLQQEKIVQALQNAYENAHKHFKAGCVEPGKAMGKAWFDDHNEPVKVYEERKKRFIASAIEYLNTVYGPMNDAHKQSIHDRMMRDDMSDLFGDSSKPSVQEDAWWKRMRQFGNQMLHVRELGRLAREYAVLCKMHIDCGMKPSKDMMLAMGPAMPWWSTVGGMGAVGAAMYAYCTRDMVSHRLALFFKQYYDACVPCNKGSEDYYEMCAARAHALHVLKSAAYGLDRHNADMFTTDLEKLAALDDVSAKREHAQFMISWYPFLRSCAQ